MQTSARQSLDLSLPRALRRRTKKLVMWLTSLSHWGLPFPSDSFRQVYVPPLHLVLFCDSPVAMYVYVYSTDRMPPCAG